MDKWSESKEKGARNSDPVSQQRCQFLANFYESSVKLANVG